MNFKIVRSIYGSQWLIEPSAALQLLDFLDRIKGDNTIWNYKEAVGEAENADHKIQQKFFGKDEVVIAPDSSWRMRDFEGFEGARVAIISINGPIMKSDYCGDLGTNSLKQLTQMANNTPSIETIIFVIDSPGGTVDGTQAFADAIKGSSKNTIAVVDGLMCSAAYWIGSSCNEIYATAQTDIIGCIGTMVAWYDNTDALKAKGIVLREYFATDSKDKNKDFNDALKGNGKALIEGTLNPLNDVFLNTVKANRAGKIDTSKEDVLSGKTYTAEFALAHGLIDGIMSFEEVVGQAQQTNYTEQTFYNKTKKNTMAEIKTLAELKAAYPVLVDGAAKEGYEAGIKAEQERVATWMVFNDVDPEAVAKGIESGEEMSRKTQAEFSKKMFAKSGLANAAADAAEPITVDPATADKRPEAAAVKAANDFWAKVDENLGIKK